MVATGCCEWLNESGTGWSISIDMMMFGGEYEGELRRADEEEEEEEEEEEGVTEIEEEGETEIEEEKEPGCVSNGS
jgi:hypothetical protein